MIQFSKYGNFYVFTGLRVPVKRKIAKYFRYVSFTMTCIDFLCFHIKQSVNKAQHFPESPPGGGTPANFG